MIITEITESQYFIAYYYKVLKKTAPEIVIINLINRSIIQMPSIMLNIVVMVYDAGKLFRLKLNDDYIGKNFIAPLELGPYQTIVSNADMTLVGDLIDKTKEKTFFNIEYKIEKREV